jgi:nucleotide-binding universal stress UspA family protein
MFHNILVAVDGSVDADEALAQAIDLAESEHTRLTLMTGVAEIAPTLYLLPGEEIGHVIENARAQAKAILGRARDRVPDDLPVTTILTEQPIRTALICRVKEAHHDLVVMGSRGRGAVRAALLGSASHYVLHNSPVPMLIVHAERSRQVRTGDTSAPSSRGQEAEEASQSAQVRRRVNAL